jgi:hypothetical protein
MAEDLLDAIRDQLANFVVGLVERVEGAGSKVLGSGVLVSIEGRRGMGFTYLNPEVADSIAAQSVFLNIEKNRGRIEGKQPTDGYCVDVMFGLVAQYSGKPVIEEGRFVSPRAVIYRGKMHSDKNALLRFQTIDDDPEKLPKDFGGLSGSGLWRIHFVDRGAGKFDIIEKRLWGITSWQIDKQNNRGAVAGQGRDRIDQALIPCVREKLQF